MAVLVLVCGCCGRFVLSDCFWMELSGRFLLFPAGPFPFFPLPPPPPPLFASDADGHFLELVDILKGELPRRPLLSAF